MLLAGTVVLALLNWLAPLPDRALVLVWPTGLGLLLFLGGQGLLVFWVLVWWLFGEQLEKCDELG